MTRRRAPIHVVLASLALTPAGCSNGADARADTVNTSIASADTSGGPSSGTDAGETTSGNAGSSSTDPTATSLDASSGETVDPSTTEAATTESTTTTTTGPATEGSTETSVAETTTTGVAADDDSIYEIQDGTIGAGVVVDVQGVVVTGVAGNAIFVQEPGGGEYSGVFVFLMAAPTVEIGDEVDLVGLTVEFNGLTEIDVTGGSITATGNTGLDLVPEVIDAADLGEPWESVLVRVQGDPVGVVALPSGDEFDVAVGGSVVRIDDFLFSPFDDAVNFPSFGVEATFSAISGPVNYFGGAFKVAPRDAADFEDYVAPPTAEFGVDDLLPGELVVTEVMINPTCAQDSCEWIEVYNATDVEIDLQGLRIQDDGMNEGTVTSSLVVPANDYVVIASHDLAGWPYAFTADAFFGNQPALGNAGDTVFLLNATDTLDATAAWGGGAVSGRAWRLDPTLIDAASNDLLGSWCYSNTPLVDGNVMGEFGTPGAANGVACN
jgi:hypothetical protein